MTTVRRLLGLHEHLSVVDIVLAILRVVVILFVVTGIYATISKGTFTLDEWGSLAVGGLALGAVYALLALGYTLVYGILFMINFAHGDVFMTGAFTAYFAAAALANSGFLAQNEVLSFIIVLLISSGVAALVLVLGLTGWFGTSRLVRAEALSVKRRDYVAAARSLIAEERGGE